MSSISTYIRRHHLGLVAVFIALTGTSYAVQSAPKNSVRTKSIRKAAVTKAKLAKRSVNGAKVVNNSLTGADINESTLGTVPKATNSDQLGGFAASAFLRGTDAIPGGDLSGTYAAPVVHLNDFASGGIVALFAQVAGGCVNGGTQGPVVNVNVGASGLVEVIARAGIQSDTGITVTACITVDGAAPVQVFSRAGAGASTTFYTLQGSTTGTNTGNLANWIPFFIGGGNHAIALRFAFVGPNGMHQSTSSTLIARAIS